MKKNHSVIIVGGGFAGIRCALDLVPYVKHGVSITLISDRDYFEYYPAMYRVVTGSSSATVKIPLQHIFKGKPVSLIIDPVHQLDPEHKKLIGKSGKEYTADSFMIAVGSETTFFNIEGMEEYSFGFKSIDKAIQLRKRIHTLFRNHAHSDLEEALVSLHFIVVGGGASGVELAGELAVFTQKLADLHQVPRSVVTLDLIEAAPRILATMPEKVSERATRRLRELGVNVFANRTLVKNESWTVFLKDMNMGARTVIWTAGVKNNPLFTSLAKEWNFDGKGRVVVDQFLQVKNDHGWYVAGDNASTPYSGLAQTALDQGSFIARDIISVLRNSARYPYIPKPVAFDIPVGPGWAILKINKFVIHGWLPWMVRHIIDLKFYLTILPFWVALRLFFAKPYYYQKSELHDEA